MSLQPRMTSLLIPISPSSLPDSGHVSGYHVCHTTSVVVSCARNILRLSEYVNIVPENAKKGAVKKHSPKSKAISTDLSLKQMQTSTPGYRRKRR